MLNYKKIVGVFLIAFSYSIVINAQYSESGQPLPRNNDRQANNQPGPSTSSNFIAPRNGVYEEEAPPPILQYDYVHQKDVFWEKRIWRVIDVREKMNHFFAYPKAPLIDIIVSHAEAGDIQLYNGAHDDFTVPLDEQQLREIGGSYDTIVTYDPETYEEVKEVVYNELDPTDIKQFRVKEVWFFDEEASRLQVRILGIAPIKDVYDDQGIYFVLDANVLGVLP